MNKEKIITVVDSPMGCGKTSAAIEKINSICNSGFPRPRIMFITPYLNEVERVKNSVNIDMVEPEISYNKGKNTKLNGLKRLIELNCDIISTHALFKSIDIEILNLLERNNYILILDEVFQVIDNIRIKKNDLKLLMDNNWIIPVEGDTNGRYQWNYGVAPNEETSFEYIKNYSDTKNLYVFNDNALYWSFPVEVFKLFKEVYILTYLFEAQIQSYYYKLHNIKYELKSAKYIDNKYQIVEYDKQQDIEFRKRMKSLLHIYDGKLNNNYLPLDIKKGKINFSLSSSWYSNKSNDKHIKKMKGNLDNYFKNVQGAKSNNRLWTCYKDQFELVKGRYGKQFISYTTRATNDYKHIENIAFLINIFMNPNEENYFTYQNIKVNSELKAVSDLLQFIYRGCIRENRPMNLYLPSQRMRRLLNDFMNEE